MYDQMHREIAQHFSVVWQAIAIIGAGFAILLRSDGSSLTDFTISAMILINSWLVAHIYNSNYWYNRNLVIIANIERQFLKNSDLQHVHYYFGKHRSIYAMVTHLRLQRDFAFILYILVILQHFYTRILPGISESICNFDWPRSIPYILIIIAYLYLKNCGLENVKKYREFLKNSPGIQIDTSNVTYGEGHPVDK
jgi:hypothetical protein